MISVLPLRKTAARLTSLAVTACCFSLAGPASAQADAPVQPTSRQTAPVPDDLLRSSGKWIGKLPFEAPPSDKAPARVAESAPLYFKPATPGWVGALDAASYIIGGISGTALPIGFSGKPFAPSPRVDNPAPSSN